MEDNSGEWAERWVETLERFWEMMEARDWREVLVFF